MDRIGEFINTMIPTMRQAVKMVPKPEGRFHEHPADQGYHDDVYDQASYDIAAHIYVQRLVILDLRPGFSFGDLHLFFHLFTVVPGDSLASGRSRPPKIEC